MQSNMFPLNKKLIPQVISYLLASITGIIGIYDWFKLREMQKVIVVNSGVSVWSWRAFDLFTFLILGIVWLSLVLYSQYYYEKGYKKGKMLKNFSRITGFQLIILFVAHLIPVLYEHKQLSVLFIIYIVGLCIIGCIVLGFSYIRRTRKLKRG